MRATRSKILNVAMTITTAVGLGLSSGVSVAGAADETPSPAAPLTWAPCETAPDFQCAFMPVPLDYDAPNGTQINVALIRKLATDPARRIGSVVFNPGGPGGVGTDLPITYPLFSPEIRARFDVVSFDPRGIGQSAQLRCFATPEDEAALLSQAPDGFPVGAEEESRWIDVYRQFGQACAQNGGPILSHMSTANVARDVERLRVALGDDRLTFYGPSYGSYLGATYANLYPSRVRAMVLDGGVPGSAWNDARTGRVLGTFLREGSHIGGQTAFSIFGDKCGQVGADRCAFTAGGTEATLDKYRTLLDRVQADPVTLQGVVFDRATTTTYVSSYLTIQNEVLGQPTGWKVLADLLQALWTLSEPGVSSQQITIPEDLADSLRSRPLPGPLASEFGSRLPEGTYGVLCSESPNPSDPSSYSAQDALASRVAPDGFGSVWTWIAEPCATWPATDDDRYTGPFNRQTVPLLVVGSVGDPSTPYSASVLMANELANARLLTQDGGGHTALINKSDCTDGHIDAYLTTGELPPVGTVCAQNEQPF